MWSLPDIIIPQVAIFLQMSATRPNRGLAACRFRPGGVQWARRGYGCREKRPDRSQSPKGDLRKTCQVYAGDYRGLSGAGGTFRGLYAGVAEP